MQTSKFEATQNCGSSELKAQNIYRSIFLVIKRIHFYNIPLPSPLARTTEYSNSMFALGDLS